MYGMTADRKKEDGFMEKYSLASVERINNPKSENHHKWYVSVFNGCGSSGETVFIHHRKSECIAYARTLSDNVHISNGIEYGAKW